jgi:drug/metabolite transporter (DMT)-like permease
VDDRLSAGGEELDTKKADRTVPVAPSPLLIDAALFSVVLMWASTFTLFKVAWRDMDPVAFTAVRFAAMFAFSLLVLALARNRVRPRRADVPALIASGLTGYFLYQMGFVLGLDRTTALASAILISTHPIFSVIFMWLARRQRATRLEVVGVVVGFLGVAVFLRAWDAFAAARPGDLLSLGAAAAFGAYGVINQPLTARYPSRELMSYGLAVGGLLVTVVGIPAMVQQDWGGGEPDVMGHPGVRHRRTGVSGVRPVELGHSTPGHPEDGRVRVPGAGAGRGHRRAGTR